ncbi:MAG: hypothetical protein AAF698_06470, partial [Pseudomonadota bacterium]
GSDSRSVDIFTPAERSRRLRWWRRSLRRISHRTDGPRRMLLTETAQPPNEVRHARSLSRDLEDAAKLGRKLDVDAISLIDDAQRWLIRSATRHRTAHRLSR